MNPHLKIAFIGLGAALCFGEARAAQAVATPVRLHQATNDAATVSSALDRSPVPRSVFTIPTSAAEGRNPFFPGSSTKVDPVLPIDPVPVNVFVLNGITSPPKRTAMINGRTFEVGEEGEVRMPGGAKVLIKCVEIGDDKAVVVANGQRKELRLRTGL